MSELRMSAFKVLNPLVVISFLENLTKIHGYIENVMSGNLDEREIMLALETHYKFLSALGANFAANIQFDIAEFDRMTDENPNKEQ